MKIEKNNFVFGLKASQRPWFGVGSSLRRAKSKALALQNKK
jgi:xylose isomerase